MQNPSEMLLENSFEQEAQTWTETHTLWLAFFYAKERQGRRLFYRAHSLSSPYPSLSSDREQDKQIKIFSLYQWMAARALNKNALSVRDVDALICLAGGQLSQNHTPDFTFSANPAEPLQRSSLIGHFFNWLHQAKGHPLTLAAEIAYSLLMIQPHPFVHFMAEHAAMLYLLQQGWLPPLLTTHLKGGKADIRQILKSGIEKTLSLSHSLSQHVPEAGIQIASSVSKLPRQLKSPSTKTMKIGALAKQVGETVPTIRYWTQEGLLHPCNTTKSGYHLYDAGMVNLCLRIQKAKAKRFTLSEIRDQLKNQ